MAKNTVSTTHDFGAVISIIENAKGRALKAVNAELIRSNSMKHIRMMNLCQHC